MPIRLGSNEYFTKRAASTEHINKIGAKVKGFDKFCAKISKVLRKCIFWMDKDDWEERVTDRVDSLKAKCAKQQVTYNVKVDNHVNQIIQGVQQDAFDSFMKQIPTLKAKLEELSKFPEFKNHPDLVKAYNAIEGQVKFDSCEALAQLKKVLADVKPGDGAEADEFYVKIEELKGELLKDSDENKFIARNLPNLTRAMVDWKDCDDKQKILVDLNEKATPDERNKAIEDYNTAQKNVLDAWNKNSKQIESLLSPEGLNSPGGLNTAKTIPLAREWAAKMKAQKASLITTLPKITDTENYSSKRYGFYHDRVDEAKKIAKLQQKDLKKLDVSFANYLADSTSELWTPLANGLKKAKTDTITRNEKNLNDTEKDLKKYTDVKDVKNLNKNKALYEKNQKVYEKYWKPLEGLDKEVGKEKASVAKLTKRINKDYSKDDANTLAALYADSAEKRKKINIELVTYGVKHGFATLCLATEKENPKPFGVKEDSNLAECGKVITKCDEAIKAFSDLSGGIAYLKKELKDPFTLESWSTTDTDIEKATFDEAQKWIGEWTKFYRLVKTKAEKRSDIIQEEILLESFAAAQMQASGAAEDKQFLDTHILPRFDVVSTNDDGNCFFHAIKAGLELQDDSRFDPFKAMSAEELRVALYDYIKANPDAYLMNIATSLSDDVVSFAKAPFDEVDVLLLQKAPALQSLYVEFRDKYQPLSSDKKVDEEELLQASYLDMKTVKLYADAMATNTTYVDMTEAFAMKNMLNINLGLYSPIVGGRDSGLFEEGKNLPVINVLRPKNKPHFELLVEKQPVVETKPVETT